MILAKRCATRPDGSRYIRALILVPEDEEESKVVDDCFGAAVGEDGLIAVGACEVRLSDGYGTHYVALMPVPKDEEGR